jgi:hypothetical protein
MREDAIARNEAKRGRKWHKSRVFWTRFGHDAGIATQVEPRLDLRPLSFKSEHRSSDFCEKKVGVQVRAQCQYTAVRIIPSTLLFWDIFHT